MRRVLFFVNGVFEWLKSNRKFSEHTVTDKLRDIAAALRIRDAGGNLAAVCGVFGVGNYADRFGVPIA